MPPMLLCDVYDAVTRSDVETLRNCSNISQMINTRIGKNKSTLLHFAVGWCDLDVVIALVELGADVNARDVNGKTPIQNAAEIRSLTVPISIYFLTLPQSDYNIAYKPGWPIFRCALRANALPDDVLCSILAKTSKESLESCDDGLDDYRVMGKSMICLAVDHKRFRLLRALLARGAQINNPIDGVGHIVHLAACTTYPHMLETVMDNGGVIGENIQFPVFTPSMSAMLIQYGAPVSAAFLSSLYVTSNPVVFEQVARRLKYSYNDPAMAHFRYNHIPRHVNGDILARIMDSYHTKEVTRHTTQFIIQAAYTMPDTHHAIGTCHNMIMAGHNPDMFVPSPHTEALIKMARQDWSESRHQYLFSRIFRSHIFNIVLARTLSPIQMPLEMWRRIMESTPRSIQITNEPIYTPERLTYARDKALRQWRAVHVESREFHTCRYDSMMGCRIPHDSE